MLAVGTHTNGRNLEPYNEFEANGIKVLIANKVIELGEEVVISLKGRPFRRLVGHVNLVAACPLPTKDA